MEKRFIDERTGIEYELIGNYYYPCLIFKGEQGERPNLSKYGLLREEYLKEYKPHLYFQLLAEGKLYEHLRETDKRANEMAELITDRMAESIGLMEVRKGDDMLEWLRKINNIRACADEIVLHDVVYD